MTSGRERALPPLDFPSGESSLSRFSGAMTQNFEVECKIFRLLPITRVSSIFWFRGLMPPTLALTFLLREKSAKAYPRGGVLLDISSFFHETSVDKKGERDRLRLLRGHRPQGYLRGVPLDTPFVSFLVKGKIPRCGARSSTKGRFAEILVRSKVSNFSLLPHNKVTSNFLLCGVTHPAPCFLWDYASHTRTDFSYTRKVSKSVCKGTPLAQPRGGNTDRLVCLRHTQPCFPRSDLRSRSPFCT